MVNKQKIELEYLFKTSSKILENMVSTPSGLSEWFADDVNIEEDIYTFYWDGSEETARLIAKRAGSYIRWKWERNDEDESFFEIHYEVDPMTKALVLKITDFAEVDEADEVTMQWETAIQNLKRIIGA